MIGGLGYGGAERLLLDICKRIDKQKFKISVCVMRDDDNFLLPDFEEYGIEVKTFNKSGKTDVELVNRLTLYLKQEKPDIVHTNLFAADFWGAWAARRAEVKKIISTRHDILNEGRAKTFLGNRSRKKMDKVIAISNVIREHLINNEGLDFEKVEVIYNGIDTRKFANPDKKILKNKPFIIGNVGRMSKEKGHKHLIRACRFLPKEDWRLQLVGDGPLRGELESIVSGLGMKENVKFIGTTHDVKKYLATWDVFVLPSESEGLSLAVLEASAAGCLVIGTNVGGVPEIIQDKKNGLLFKAKNIEQLFSHLQWVFENPREAKKLAAQMQNDVKEKFDINLTVKQYQDLYNSL